MNRLKGKCRLALALLALALSGVGTARGQYSVTGTTPGGGNIVTGAGTALGNLGPGSPLSANGSDSITFQPGSIALGSGSDTVQIATSNDTLLNNGTILGAATYNAVSFLSGSGPTGETITNNGLITVLGSGTISNELAASFGGSHYAGSNVGVAVAVTSSIRIGTVTLSNAGTIAGGSIAGFSGGAVSLANDSYYGSGFNVGAAVAVTSNGGIGTLTLSNSGTITGGSIGSMSDGVAGYSIGGEANAGFNVGAGVAVTTGNGGIGTVTLSNAGTITGGSIGSISGYSYAGAADAGEYDAGFNVGTAVSVTSPRFGSGIGTVTLSNAGTIAGGGIGSISDYQISANRDDFSNMYGSSAADAGFNAGAAVAVTSGKGIGTVTLSNAGTITGGSIGSINGINGISEVGVNNSSSSDTGFNVGAAVAATSYNGIGTVTLSNAGTITGGSIGSINGGSEVGVDINSDVSAGFNVGVAVSVTSIGGIGTVTLSNAGTIAGGSIGSISDGLVGADNNSFGGAGYNVGNAVSVSSLSGIGTVTLSNAGTITGGSIGSISGGSEVGAANDTSGDAGCSAGTAVSVASSGGIGTVTLSNAGTITGGSIGSISGGSLVGAAINGFDNVGVGFDVSVGVGISSGGAINSLSLVNYGSISGGNIGSIDNTSTVAPDAASAIVIHAGAAGGNLGITNYGSITGGNVGSGAPAGYGIVSNAGNLTINNYGAISAGSGPAEPGLPAGFPNVAVSISGNNNTINLNGHSSVNGTLQGTGSNNVLNLDFTGVSPAALANLKAQLAAQGWPGTNDFTGTFTLRGVTYYVDPIPLDITGITSYEGQAITPNQFALAVSLDSATVNPVPGSSLFNLFNAIDQSGNVPAALAALSPQQYQAYGDLAIANTTAMVQNVDARVNNIRDGSESIDTTGVGGTSDATTTAGYSKDDGKESKNIVQTAPPEKRWGMFATGDGLFFRGNSHDVDLQDDRSNSAGTLAGVDAKIGEHVIAGALFSYNNTDATLGSNNNSGHATIESYSGGIYGSYHQDGFYLNGLAAYTRNHYSSDRNILIPGFAADASTNTNSNQESVNLDGGYDWHATDRLTLGPIAGLQYVHLDVNGFNEIGAGAADLAVNSQDMNSLQSRVGGRVNYHLSTSQYSSFAADFHAAWQHEFLDDSRSISASFIGDGLTPFSVQTTSPLRDAAVVGLGLNFTFHDRLTLFADYELLLWRASTFEQTLNGGGRISF